MTQFHQERDEVPGRKIMIVLIAVLAAVAGFVLFAYGLESCRTGELREAAAPVEETIPLPPEVNAMELTTFDQEAQGLEANEAARERLRAYGWVDREDGVIHIPIEEAFDLYLERRKEGEP